MSLELVATGEVVETSEPMGELELDDGGMLAVNYMNLRKTISQLVRALNNVTRKTLSVENVSLSNQDTIEDLQQQIVETGMRLRECEETCQEVRVEVGTMGSSPLAAAEEEALEADQQDTRKVLERVDALAERCDQAESRLNEVAVKMRSELSTCGDRLHKIQDTLEGEFVEKLAGLDDTTMALRAETEALRSGREEDMTKKANKSDLAECANQVAELISEQRHNYGLLTDARKKFEKLDLLMCLVEENKTRMQEISRVFREEYSELRCWASGNLSQLRTDLRDKIDEREVVTSVEQLRKEFQRLWPQVREVATKAHNTSREKAEASEVARLSDAVEHLKQYANRNGQLLIGTKCLACDRLLSQADGTDQGRISLERARQQEALFHEVERSLVENAKNKASEVLKFVAVHVGSPGRSKGFDTQHSTDGSSPGGHSIVRHVAPRRPWTSPDAGAGVARAPPREATPLVRSSARTGSDWRARVSPLASRAVVPHSSKPSSMRHALGPPGGSYGLGGARLPPSPDQPEALGGASIEESEGVQSRSPTPLEA